VRRWLLSGLLIGAALIAPSSVAGAQQYPICTITPSITAENTSGGVRVQGSGFTAPFEDVELTIDGGNATQLVGPTFTAVIPVRVSGEAVVRAVATAAGTDTTCQATARVDVPPPPPPPPSRPPQPPDIPRTGSDTTGMVWIGLAAVGIGALLVVAARRRRSVRQVHHGHGRAYHSDAAPVGVTSAATAAAFVQHTPTPRQSVPPVTPVPELSPPTPLPSRTLVTAGVVASPGEPPAPPVHDVEVPMTPAGGAAPPTGVTLLTTELELPSSAPPEAPSPAAPDFETSLRVMRATFAEWVAEAESAHPG
jgi:LPXTG-motif cell wall-anchored protein